MASSKDPAPPQRVNLGDGQPPAYVFTSPCCGKPSLVPAWMVEYARANTGGQLTLQCGRSTTDPIRSVVAVRVEGCGRCYTVQVVSQGGQP
jgi:hypothetical protein